MVQGTPDTLSAKGTLVLRPAGAIDVRRVEELHEEWQGLLGQGYLDWVVDLQDTSMLDSSGLGLLVRQFMTLKSRGGALRVVTDNERFLDLFRITRLDKLIKVETKRPS